MANFVDNSNDVLKELQDKIERGMTAIGKSAVRHAMKDCPVDTGRLRGSIDSAVVDDTAFVGTNVEYAPYVELIDKRRHTTGKAHFLRDSVANHDDEYRKILEAALR